MQQKYKGKKVLVIGMSKEFDFLLPYLKDNGAYVILTQHSAKTYSQYSDEIFQINLDNIEEIVDFCGKNQVFGVLSSSTESTFEKCRIINEKLGNKFLYNEKQWNTFCIKDNFKKVCAKYGIRTPEIYFSGSENEIKNLNRKKLKYPLVTKPVDSCGGRGCYKCDLPFELTTLIKHTLLNSQSKKIIIEEYLKGQEATLTFVIHEGKCRMVTATDRYLRYKRKFKDSIHSYFIAPSCYADCFIHNDFKKFENMFLSEGLNNCQIFVQGFFIKNEFIPTEAGLRFEGTSAYLDNSHFNKQNFMHFCVDQILKSKTDYDINKDSYKFNGNICLYVGVYLKKGIIGSIEGLNKLESLNGHYLTVQYRDINQFVDGDVSINRILLCVNYSCTSYADVKGKIKSIRKYLKVKDKNGGNMIMKYANIRKVRKSYGNI